MNSTGHDGEAKTIKYWLAAIVALGCALRLVASWQTLAIVPDGPLYIFQAKSIYALQFKQTLDCLPYLSSYPVLIALAFPLFQDWLLAAQAVSLACGAATIFPVYLLVRQIVNAQAALITAAIFAVLPTMVGISADVLRDATFWFFSATGLYLFVKGFDTGKPLPLLTTSFIFQLLALWTRIEGVVLVVISAGFLFLSGFAGRPLKRWALTLLALFATGLILAAGLNISGIAPGSLFRIPELLDKSIKGFAAYSGIRAELATMMKQHMPSPTGFFLEEARSAILLVGIGVIFNRFLETLCYLYALFFLIGLPLAFRECKNDRKILYLMLCCAGLLIMYYYQIIINWMLYYRMMAAFLLPASIVIGFGAARILAATASATKMKESIILGLLIIGIAFFSLPKNLAARNTGELIFRQIGETIAAATDGTEGTKIWSSPVSRRIVSLYANLDATSYSYSEKLFEDETIKGLAHDPAALNQRLRESGYRYFVWEEAFWRDLGAITPDNLAAAGKYVSRSEWKNTPAGKIILYELTP